MNCESKQTSIKLYVAGCREAPKGWVRVKSAAAAKELLKAGVVETLSLDNHLGNEVPSGLDLLNWLRQEVAETGLKPPGEIQVHTGCEYAGAKMRCFADDVQRQRYRWLERAQKKTQDETEV